MKNNPWKETSEETPMHDKIVFCAWPYEKINYYGAAIHDPDSYTKWKDMDGFECDEPTYWMDMPAIPQPTKPK